MENAIGSKNNTVEGFLGERWFSAMKTVLDEIGVEALEDFKEINKEEIDMLAAKLKGVQARKFVKKINELNTPIPKQLHQSTKTQTLSMTGIADEDYLKMCKGKSFLLSKAVTSGKSGDSKECFAAISEVKTKIETKHGAKMGAGFTKRFLGAKGFKDNEKLGADQIVTNETLGLHHPNLDGDDLIGNSKWVKAFQAYAAATKYGVLILAKTPENFQVWAKSGACLNEVKGIPYGRLYVYIEHTEDDEGGIQGYICAVRRGAESKKASATVKNGRGYLLHANGDYYHGELKKGKKHGKGKYIRVDGDIYDGDWKDGSLHGKGKYTWSDGNVYDGDWKDDKMHGKGKHTWSDGAVYEGDWKDGKQHGKGKYTYSDGAVYEGDFKDDKQHRQ